MIRCQWKRLSSHDFGSVIEQCRLLQGHSECGPVCFGQGGGSTLKHSQLRPGVHFVQLDRPEIPQAADDLAQLILLFSGEEGEAAR